MATFNFPSGSGVTPGDASDDGTGGIALGFVTAPRVAGLSATGIRWYAVTSMTVTPYIWAATDSLALVSGPSVACTVGWNFLPFTAPLALTNGTTYVPSVWSATAQYSAAAAWPVTSTQFTSPASGGRYSYGMDASLAAASPSSSSSFGVDIVATDGSGASYAGSVTLSGTGTQSRAGTPRPATTLALSGTGTQTRAGTPRPVAALGLSATGTLVLAGTPKPGATLALSGTGTTTFSGAGESAASGTVALSGTGTMQATGGPNMSATLPLTGTGSLASNGTPAHRGALSATGAGSTSFTGGTVGLGALSLSATGTLAFAASPSLTQALALAGAGTLAPSGLPRLAAALAFSSTGTLTLRSTDNEHKVTVTGALGPARWVGQLDPRAEYTATLDSRWFGNLGD